VETGHDRIRHIQVWGEAFTPAPDTDMSVADAHAAWPGKVLWINYPSSLHIASAARIREETRRLVREGRRKASD
jgi:hypothetical protein